MSTSAQASAPCLPLSANRPQLAHGNDPKGDIHLAFSFPELATHSGSEMPPAGRVQTVGFQVGSSESGLEGMIGVRQTRGIVNSFANGWEAVSRLRGLIKRRRTSEGTRLRTTMTKQPPKNGSAGP